MISTRDDLKFETLQTMINKNFHTFFLNKEKYCILEKELCFNNNMN